MLNDDDDYMDDEMQSDQWKPFYQAHKKLSEKAREMFHLILALKESFSDKELEEDHHHPYHLMMENITMAMAKLAGAKVMEDLYHGLMENAVLIKVNMTELNVQVFAAREFYNGDPTYLQVIKDELEEFRKLFIEWRNTFDSAKDQPDEWHLFNDPGSFPKDDEPFDPNEFLGGMNEDDDDDD